MICSRNENIQTLHYYKHCLIREALYFIFFGAVAAEVVKYTNFFPRCNAAWLMSRYIGILPMWPGIGSIERTMINRDQKNHCQRKKKKIKNTYTSVCLYNTPLCNNSIIKKIVCTRYKRNFYWTNGHYY